MTNLIQRPNFYVNIGEYKPASFQDKMDNLLNHISRESKIPVSTIKSRTRKREVVTWRQIGIYIAYLKNYGSFKDIGFYFNGLDHSTAIHSKQTIQDFIEINDKKVIQYIKSIEHLVGTKNNYFKKS
jgi:chromosomal replication initiator protein